MKPDYSEISVITEDRGDVLTTMYRDDDETDGVPGTRTFELPTSRTRRIKVGAIEYEVPTIDYMQRLENALMQHSRTMEHQQRMIARLAAMVSRTQNLQQARQSELDDLRRELSNKVNQRDSF